MRDRATRWIACALLGACCANACGDDSDGSTSNAGGGAPSTTSGAGAPSPPGLAEVGRACVPTFVPEGEISEQEAYLEGDNASCGDGVCLVYRVAGDPRPECAQQPGACFASDPACRGEGRCADPADVQRHVHCSCRCEAPNPRAAVCTCPDGFICVPVLEQGDPSVVGSYCVRN